MDEILTQVTDQDEIIGPVSRIDCHRNPSLIHRSVHVLVLNSDGLLLLQKRSMNKDMQPGKWDTSVGGHVGFGQSYLDAAHREGREELGVPLEHLKYLYFTKVRIREESENLRTYLCLCDGPFFPCSDEIEEVRFWSRKEIESEMGNGYFTPHFELEFAAFVKSPFAVMLA